MRFYIFFRIDLLEQNWHFIIIKIVCIDVKKYKYYYIDIKYMKVSYINFYKMKQRIKEIIMLFTHSKQLSILADRAK